MNDEIELNDDEYVVNDLEYQDSGEIIDEVEESIIQEVAEDEGIVSTTATIADESIDKLLEKLKTVGSTEEVKKVISDLGLTPYIKDVTKDRVKTILSLFGLWYMKKFFKNKKFAIGLLISGGAYLMLKNDNKILDKVTNKII